MNRLLEAWGALAHGGQLVAPARLEQHFPPERQPAPLRRYAEERLRRAQQRFADGRDGALAELLDALLEDASGLGTGDATTGRWLKRPQDLALHGERLVSGELHRPRGVWVGPGGAELPVFVHERPAAEGARFGAGRSQRTLARTVEWLRRRTQRLALVTDGSRWRLVHAGLDHESWVECDGALWFEGGGEGPHLFALRALLAPGSLAPTDGTPAPLLAAIDATRRGQAELSAELGERVRQAVERLVREHGAELVALRGRDPGVEPRHVHLAAVRVVMRMVVVLFAEARGLLPRDTPAYRTSYGLGELYASLARLAHGRSAGRLRHRYGAWPRVLAFFRLLFEGSRHPDLLLPRYGGGLFAPGAPDARDPVARALAVFETAALGHAHGIVSDEAVHALLELLTRTTVAVRDGRAVRRVSVPVDFSDLGSEYIGILYEGLLDYELRRAGEAPVVFLALGDEPALPLDRLEDMTNDTLARLVEKLKKEKATEPEEDGAGEDEQDDEEPAGDEGESQDDEPQPGFDETLAALQSILAEPEPAGELDDARLRARDRALAWAKRAVEAGGLVGRPRSKKPDALAAHAAAVEARARALVPEAGLKLPGEWYLVRFGGTRKGSGTFYTRPQLAVPTTHRTLRPLAYVPPAGAGGEPDEAAPPAEWRPRQPQEILALRVCDPACGSGSFLVAALRFLTAALADSLIWHKRIREDGRYAILTLAEGRPEGGRLSEERLPCRPDEPDFEARLAAVLRRHVVERCLHGVDLDPLAVELARLALWIETMDRELPFTFLDHRVRCGNSLVGAWHDTFHHYPLLAWAREAGDEKHDGVHHVRQAPPARGRRAAQARESGDVWAAALKARREQARDQLAAQIVARAGGQQSLRELSGVADAATHARAAELLEKLHGLPLFGADSAEERERLFRDEFRAGSAVQGLRAAMDAWCALWFWPGDALGEAPLPGALGEPAAADRVREIARELRFFHWEVEFADVFTGPWAGFDAILGNPPWDTLQPVSKEFFSNRDPLYRGYGKQEALAKQREMFGADANFEAEWLGYVAHFKSLANWTANATRPFGDPEGGGEAFSFGRGQEGLHAHWRRLRAGGTGFADPEHPYRWQGEGKAYTYKLFLELAHALLKPGGRLGFVVPSGLYSDKGSSALRELFLDRCRWEWLFGFENRNKLFDIHRSFKFAPVIVTKGGETEAVRAAFMHHDLGDWERAETFALRYPRAQVERFSPRTKALLEVRSQRDLEVLEKMYANTVLLGDDGPDGWGVKYAQGDFNMTSDSKLFHARPALEAEGYRADIYGRWIKPRAVSADVARARREAGWLELADGSGCVAEGDVEDMALPLYQGVMVHQFEWTARRFAAEPVTRDDPTDLMPSPVRLIKSSDPRARHGWVSGEKLGYRRIARNTDARTVLATPLAHFPAGDSLFFYVPQVGRRRRRPEDVTAALSSVFNSIAYDFQVRARLGGTNLSDFIMAETGVPPPSRVGDAVAGCATRLSRASLMWSVEWLSTVAYREEPWRRLWAITPHERLRLRCMLDAVVAKLYGLAYDDLAWILRDCDHPVESVTDRSFARRLDPKGFWRVDKDKDPELRHSVLSLVALRDLESAIAANGGSVECGIEAFCEQEGGDGWMLPETLRLADLGLGHDDRARHPQPVADRMGERFLPWQLDQGVEESWAECHRHARNILGESGYARLQRELRGEAAAAEDLPMVAEHPTPDAPGAQQRLFPTAPDLLGTRMEDAPGGSTRRRGRR